MRPNIVQSIRAFRVRTCRRPRMRAGQHFLYANLATAQTKQDVLDLIAQQFTFPAHFGKNFDALYDCMTDPVHKSGPQPGFVVVLEQLPGQRQVRQGSARAAARHLPRRRRLLGRPEDTLQVLLFFSVARSAAHQPSRTGDRGGPGNARDAGSTTDRAAKKMPTDKLVDVTQLRAGMSSPFNAAIWLERRLTQLATARARHESPAVDGLSFIGGASAALRERDVLGHRHFFGAALQVERAGEAVLRPASGPACGAAACGAG